MQEENMALQQRIQQQPQSSQPGGTPSRSGPSLAPTAAFVGQANEAAASPEPHWRAVATVAVLAAAFAGVHYLPLVPHSGADPRLVSGSFCAAPPVTMMHWLGLAVAMVCCTLAAGKGSLQGGFEARGLGFLVGLVAVLAAFGNVAHTHSAFAMGAFAVFSASLVAMVSMELRGHAFGQEMATVGLLLGAAMSSFVSTNSLVFCGGVFFAALSALHLTGPSGRVSKHEFAKRGFNANSPRAQPPQQPVRAY